MKTEEGETQVETTPAEAMEIENGIEIPFEKARVLKGHDSEVCMFINVRRPLKINGMWI